MRNKCLLTTVLGLTIGRNGENDKCLENHTLTNVTIGYKATFNVYTGDDFTGRPMSQSCTYT